MELVREYWLDVGVGTRIKSEDWSLFWEKMTPGQHEVSVWLSEFGDLGAIVFSAAYIPARGDSQFAVARGSVVRKRRRTHHEATVRGHRAARAVRPSQGNGGRRGAGGAFPGGARNQQKQFSSIGIAYPPGATAL